MEKTQKEALELGVDILTVWAHKRSKESGWWRNLSTGKSINPNDVVPEKLMLVVSELSEAMEGHRKDLMDDKLPHRKMIEVELADACLRIADLAGALRLNLGGAIIEKMEYNRTRADHQIENRAKEGGKKF